MPKAKPLPHRPRICELLDYDAEMGIFMWCVDRTRGIKAGDVAGCTDSDGYIRIRIDGTRYKASRLAWLMVYGEDPGDLHVDHINGRREDDRFCNLRLASHSENGCNSKRRVDNSTGFKGVQPHRGRYQSQIRVAGRQLYLGLFSTPEEAHEAYCTAARRYHGAFARTA